MTTRRAGKGGGTRWGVHIALIVGGAFMVLPFLWMLSTALKPTEDILAWPPQWIPERITFEHFIGVFTTVPFARFFLNSIIVSVMSVTSILVSSLLAGYVFSKHSFPGRDLIFMVILATAIVPLQVYLVPLYLIVSELQLLDTYLGIALPTLFMSFGIFLMRQHISTIPNDLIAAARIDGCGEWLIVRHVIFPLSRSALSALGIYAFIAAWGAFLWPLIVTNSIEKYVIELGITMFSRQYYTQYGLTMAAATVTVLPMIIVFLVFRRNIIQGITMTGMK